MPAIAPLRWEELRELQVVRSLAKMIRRRWSLGLGFVTPDGSCVRPPLSGEADRGASLCPLVQRAENKGCETTALRIAQMFSDLHRSGEIEHAAITYTCHAGLQEIAVPVVIEGQFVGCLLAGGFVPSDGAGEAFDEFSRRTAPLRLPVADREQAVLAHPCLSLDETSHLNELLELCAEEIVAFCTEVAIRDRKVGELQRELGTRYSYDAIIGRAETMQSLYRMLDKVIDSDSTVLIQGENGTGKELVARAIHYNSNRKDRRFVVQNCSAFNDNLLDSELFGHKRGSFTGAVADKQGLFAVADGGTFFLDEIGDMSPTLQVKLLRVLQEGTFLAVGDTKPSKVDVRIIAATNRNLKEMIENGQFREDLYYRINVINLITPSLRDRKDDIPILTDHFLKKRAKNRRGTKRLSKDTLKRLMDYHWPGNVRELENEIERLVVLSGDERAIGEDLLSLRIREETKEKTHAGPTGLPDAVADLERKMIYEVLSKHRWNKTRAAVTLKISRRNLIRLVQKYELEPNKPPGSSAYS